MFEIGECLVMQIEREMGEVVEVGWMKCMIDKRRLWVCWGEE